MIPPLHFTQVGDHLLRERPLLESAALRFADAYLTWPRTLPLILVLRRAAIWDAAAGQPEARLV